MIEIVELTLTKIMAGSFVHRSEVRGYEYEQIIFPMWNRLSIPDYLCFSKLSDKELEQRGISKFGEADRIYEVGDKDIVLIKFDCVGNMGWYQTNIEAEMDNIGYEEVFEPHAKDIQELIKPIVDTMKPHRKGEVEVTWRVLTLWDYDPNCTHDYYDGDDCDPVITLVGLLEQKALQSIAKELEQK